MPMTLQEAIDFASDPPATAQFGIEVGITISMHEDEGTVLVGDAFGLSSMFRPDSPLLNLGDGDYRHWWRDGNDWPRQPVHEGTVTRILNPWAGTRRRGGREPACGDRCRGACDPDRFLRATGSRYPLGAKLSRYGAKRPD